MTTDKIHRGCPSHKNGGSCAKLDVYDWLGDVTNTANAEEYVEIRFKNTRKDYYRNVNELKLKVGDMVAVEASPGHDIGMVSLTGDLVLTQMKRHKVTLINGELRKVYRHAKPVDIEKWEVAMKREHETMIHSRQIALDLNLNMKIGDVEYQGDGTKAIFYYIADERVDFRQLIKVLAETFKIRIEMKQIGARQEAGRIGGIGPCGRELCCCTWVSSFVSVTTNAARYQDVSLNPQKLAGQCSKLKCCLNYEVDAYIDEQKSFPSQKTRLETEEGTYVFVKSDIFQRMFWYTLDNNSPSGIIGISVDRVRDIQRMNRKGNKPEKLMTDDNLKNVEAEKVSSFGDVVGQDSLTRFDKPKGERKRRPKRNNTNDRQKSDVDKSTKESSDKSPNEERRNRRRRPQRNAEGRNNDKSRQTAKRENSNQNDQPTNGDAPLKRADQRKPQNGKPKEKDGETKPQRNASKNKNASRPPRNKQRSNSNQTADNKSNTNVNQEGKKRPNPRRNNRNRGGSSKPKTQENNE